jgi:hypothetical protein
MAINLSDLKGVGAIDKLSSYSGKNPYLSELKVKFIDKGKLTLTPNQEAYILENHDKEPFKVDRVVGISSYLGTEFQTKYNLKFVPERIYIGFILAENEKAFHVYGKLTQKQPSYELYWLPKTQVLDDPYFESIDVNVDFQKYIDLDILGRTPYQHQKEGVQFLLSRKKCILADDMGLGKGVVINTLAITPTGTKKFGELKVGDRIIGSNGKPCNITGVYPQGVKDTYKVTFNDGYSITTDGSHLWSVSSCNSGENSKNRETAYVVISTEQMLDKELELINGNNEKYKRKFKTYYKCKNGDSKWQIPIVKPIEFENNDDLPIEPYFLGLSLGDGHFNSSSTIIFNMHKDDADELFIGVDIHSIKTKLNKTEITVKTYQNQIKQLGLAHSRSDTKFIPDIYKYSSIESRLAILQGLMDTDGHCMKSKNGNFIGTEYCTVSERLADDVAEIVHSLGGIVRKKSKIGKYKKPDGTVVVCKKAYRLNIKLPESFNPFRLKRKADRYNIPKKYKVGRYIKNIEPVGKAETVCIAVDAPDKLYVTEHGIVTHNTTQSIIAALESGAKKILIICPSSNKINWEREIHMLQEYDTSIISGRKWNPAKFTIINYDILKNFHTAVKRGVKPDVVLTDMVDSQFDLMIVDEAHYLKNHDSIRGMIVADLVKKLKMEYVWLLTGTPVANRPKDLYNLLKIIDHPLADNWQFYVKRYCDGKKITRKLKSGQTKTIWLVDGSSNLDELSVRIKNVFMRRMKNEVIDMPDKIIVPTHQELSASEYIEYEGLWEEYLIKRAEEKKRGTPDRDLVELILLRQFIALKAVPHTIEMAEDIIENGGKVIIFTSFSEELLTLQEHFGRRCVAHHGSMNSKDKQKSVDVFQNNSDIKVFIGNIMSAGVGITLTAADTVIFNSFDWVTGNNEQAEDRAYRIGQKNNVTVYYQLFQDTITTRMWYTLKYKKSVIDKILGVKNKEEEIITEFIECTDE